MLNAVGTKTMALSSQARNFQWLLHNFMAEVRGVHSVAVVSSDGLLLLGSEPDDAPERRSGHNVADAPAHPGLAGQSRMDLAAVVSGLASLTVGAARLMDAGRVRQTTVAMTNGVLVVMSISDGSLLGVHAAADCDMSVVGFQMALFVGRAGHVLTPALRSELRLASGSTG